MGRGCKVCPKPIPLNQKRVSPHEKTGINNEIIVRIPAINA
jgi:hypothetical protein